MQENMIEKNIIISEPCSTLRALGKNALEGRWKVAILAVCIYVACVNFPPLIFDSIFGINIGSVLTSSGYTYGIDPGTYAFYYNNMPNQSWLSFLYILLVTGAFELGVSIFFLATFRRHEVNCADIFLGFEKFGKALGLFFYMTLFIFLWTLLFIIPGIIAAIRYSQAFYVLADDPTKSVRQCMDESKRMMRGNKATYFVLNISFLGWALLCAIPSAIIETIGTIISSNTFVIQLFAFIGSFCMVPLTVYMASTMAGFYEILAGHLVKETAPVPVTVEDVKAMVEENLASEMEEAKADAETEAAEVAEEIAEEVAKDTAEEVEGVKEEIEDEQRDKE